MPNRLASETSPYLLQHKDNPIDWWPWCEEAWETAQREQKAVFLSIGYSSCHWCHVMAHESFEDNEVAAALNQSFVCIKLDREERPDIDEVYMTAVQLSNGHGGWPMSLFLTSDKKPFFAGTYFPREARGEFPGFLTIIGSLAKAWRDQRTEVLKAADDFASAIAGALERTLPTDMQYLNVSILDQAVEQLHQDYDHENGGFGDKPKFPPHASLRFLLDYAGLREDLGGEFGDLPERAGHMALYTLEKIALGGIHDHVGGGFHRYSTDERWLLPHFEKMLYDNAQLIGAFNHAASLVTDERLRGLFTRVVDRAIDWVAAEMTAEDGTFFSALDADTGGQEGAYYVWTEKELVSVGVSDEFLTTYQIKGEGNFLEEASRELTGENVLHLLVDQGTSFDDTLKRLADRRAGREAPGLDTKALMAWNGLMVSTLIECNRLDLAVKCAERWLEVLADGPPHMISHGVASGSAFLDDLAYFADGLLDLAESTGDRQWLDAANTIADRVRNQHLDEAGGGYFLVSSDGEKLFGRSKPFLDNACPSPNGIMARVLRRLDRQEESVAAIMAGMGWVQRAPRATETILREILWTLVEQGVPSETQLSSQQTLHVSATLAPQTVYVGDDGWGYLEVVVSMPDGVHINSNEPLAKWLSPTTVSVEGVYGEASFSEAIDGIYRGETRIALRVRPKTGSTEFEVSLRYQACTESECLMPADIKMTGMLVAR